LVVFSLFNKLFQFDINLENAFLLNLFDVGNGEAVGAINSYAEVMILFNNVTLNKAILIEFVIDHGVHLGVFSHGNGASLDKERQHSDFWVHCFHFISEVN